MRVSEDESNRRSVSVFSRFARNGSVWLIVANIA